MTLKDITTELGEILERKNAAYGNSAEDLPKFLTLLFPNGVQPDRYQDLLFATRIFDKLKRLATDPDFANEDAALDLAGYGVLWTRMRRKSKVQVSERREKCENCEYTRHFSCYQCWVCHYDVGQYTPESFIEALPSWKKRADYRELQELAKRGVS